MRAFGAGIMAMAAASTITMATAGLAADSSEDARFKTIYSAEWTWREHQQADDEDSGDRISAHLPDVGPAAQAARLDMWSDVMATLVTIDATKLSPENRINLQVYRNQIVTLLAAQRYREYQKPLNADTSFWGDVAGSARQSFKTERDYRDYLTMLGEVPRYFTQQIANMKAGEARGFTPPKITLEGRDATVTPIVDAKTPQDNRFYAPFRTMPAAIPVAVQAELRAQAVAVIQNAVVPAHATLLAFLRDDYIPHARIALDATSLPDGKAYYQSKIREFTTLDLPPQQIHQIGLDEVAKIHGEMLDVMKQVAFKGDLPAFLTYLRTDPSFYAKTPQDLLDRAAWIAKTFDGKAKSWFGRLPRSRFAIIPVPADIAPFYTGGRLSGQHLQSAVAPALFADRTDSARKRARPRLPNAARRREQGPAGLPPAGLYLGLRRRLGALLREARRRNGDVRHPL